MQENAQCQVAPQPIQGGATTSSGGRRIFPAQQEAAASGGEQYREYGEEAGGTHKDFVTVGTEMHCMSSLKATYLLLL